MPRRVLSFTKSPKLAAIITCFLDSNSLDRFYEVKETEAALINGSHLYGEQGNCCVHRLQELLCVVLKMNENQSYLFKLVHYFTKSTKLNIPFVNQDSESV